MKRDQYLFHCIIPHLFLLSLHATQNELKEQKKPENSVEAQLKERKAYLSNFHNPDPRKHKLPPMPKMGGTCTMYILKERQKKEKQEKRFKKKAKETKREEKNKSMHPTSQSFQMYNGLNRKNNSLTVSDNAKKGQEKVLEQSKESMAQLISEIKKQNQEYRKKRLAYVKQVENKLDKLDEQSKILLQDKIEEMTKFHNRNMQEIAKAQAQFLQHASQVQAYREDQQQPFYKAQKARQEQMVQMLLKHQTETHDLLNQLKQQSTIQQKRTQERDRKSFQKIIDQKKINQAELHKAILELEKDQIQEAHNQEVLEQRHHKKMLSTQHKDHQSTLKVLYGIEKKRIKNQRKLQEDTAKAFEEMNNDRKKEQDLIEAQIRKMRPSVQNQDAYNQRALQHNNMLSSQHKEHQDILRKLYDKHQKQIKREQEVQEEEKKKLEQMITDYTEIDPQKKQEYSDTHIEKMKLEQPSMVLKKEQAQPDSLLYNPVPREIHGQSDQTSVFFNQIMQEQQKGAQKTRQEGSDFFKNLISESKANFNSLMMEYDTPLVSTPQCEENTEQKYKLQ